MKMKIFCITAAVVMVLSGCKKNAPAEQDVNTGNPVIKKSKAWFEKEIKKNATGLKEILVVPGEKPQWDNAVFFATEGLLVTPLAINEKVAKFLVTIEGGTSEIEGGYYCYVLGNGDKPNVTPALLSGNSSPGFNGAMVSYTLDGHLMASMHYKAGEPVGTEDILKAMIKKHNAGTQGLAPLNDGCHYETIDWFWQTYENGVLIFEEYLFSTTSVICEEAGGGGGAITCEQRLQSFIAEGKPIDGPTTRVTTLIDNTHMDIAYNWLIFEARSWGLLSYEKGTVEKVHYPNGSRWEYTAFDHNRITSAGVSVGGTRTYEDLGATINISPIRTSARVRIDFKVDSKVCNIPTFSQPFNSNKTFYAPNTVVVVPD